MRRVRFPFGFFLGLLILRLPLLGQDTTATNSSNSSATNDPAAAAAAMAAQQGEEEKFKQINADLESLRAANQVLTDKLAAATEQLREVRAEQTRMAGDSSVPDQLKLLSQKMDILAQKIEEVDKKRLDDKDAISEEIKKSSERLLKMLAEATAASAPKTTNHPTPPVLAGGTTNGVSYKIKDGDTGLAILAAYNEKLKSDGRKKISLEQIDAVNTNLDWKHLKVGQVIMLPLPPE
jgi:hypothetical protein